MTFGFHTDLCEVAMAASGALPIHPPPVLPSPAAAAAAIVAFLPRQGGCGLKLGPLLDFLRDFARTEDLKKELIDARSAGNWRRAFKGYSAATFVAKSFYPGEEQIADFCCTSTGIYQITFWGKAHNC